MQFPLVQSTLGADVLRLPGPGAPIAADALFHYTMERWDADGVTMLDQSGNDNPGERMSGSLRIVSGVISNALSIESDGTGISFNAHEPLFPVDQEAASFSWWFKTAHGGGDRVMICRGVHWGGINMQLAIHGTVEFRLRIAGGSTNRCLSDPGLDNDVWHHVVCLWDRAVGEMRLYIDGSLVDTEAHDSDLYREPSYPKYTSQIGHFRKYDGSVRDPYQGLIDDVRLFLRALTDAEIAALYAQGNP